MFLILDKTIDSVYTVLDTEDGVIDKVDAEFMENARLLGVVFKDGTRHKDYATFHTKLVKLSIGEKLDCQRHLLELYNKLHNFSKFVESLVVPDDITKFKICAKVLNNYFIIVLNTLENTDRNSSYMYTITKEGIFCKQFWGSLLELTNDMIIVSSLTTFGQVKFLDYNNKCDLGVLCDIGYIKEKRGKKLCTPD